MDNKPITHAEIQQIELGVLVRARELFKARGLAYYLCGGTLLGAIRHKGFIPWDNDIDICMPRADYDRLIALIKANELPSDLRAYYPGMPGYPYPYLKLCDPGTRVIEGVYEKSGVEIGVYIDVFPQDKLYKNKLRRTLQILGVRALNKLNSRRFGAEITTGNAVSRSIKRALSVLSTPLVPLLKRMDIASVIDGRCRSYQRLTDYRLGNLAWGTLFKDHYSRECYKDTIEAEFEGERFAIPAGYEEYLTRFYGDYMQMPKEEERVTHDMKAYRKASS